MTDTEIIKAVAELDGGTNFRQSTPWECWDEPPRIREVCSRDGKVIEVPNYLTSRDAIIPVIEKQKNNIKIVFSVALSEVTNALDCETLAEEQLRMILATPRQLCEALLRATGKWKE